VFAGPSYPPPPEGSAEPDHLEVDLGIAVLGRWPVLDARPVVMPARHRSWDPVALVVRLAHPAGPLPVVAACLDYGVPYTDDRIAQGELVAQLATDPELDGPCPVLLMGDLNAAVESPVLRAVRDRLVDAWPAGGGDPAAVTLPSSHPSAPLEAGRSWSTSGSTTSSSGPVARTSTWWSRGCASSGTRSTGCSRRTTAPCWSTCAGAADVRSASRTARPGCRRGRSLRGCREG
jgi:hypothetical protein